MNSLKTDLYELTMAAGYFQNRVDVRATFELLCYKEPKNRSYLITCGLEQVVDYILNLRFSDEEIEFLRRHPAFRSVGPAFFDYLKGFRFTGNLWAMPEGEIFFANEPIIQVEAPIIEAQILETYILSVIHIQTLVATKASRVVRAACSDKRDRGVIDFGSRRAHGPEAGVLAARAAYVGGCLGTSNVYAGKTFNIPMYGTMAHSWVETFDKEEEAFSKYYEVFPDNTILLIDTYNTLKAAKKVAALNKDIKAVRLDSGNLEVLSKKVRRILDKNGLQKVKIIASGSLNEYTISELVRKKAPIDFFGVGTEMVTSKDMPSLDLIYKLVQTETKSGDIIFKSKLSQEKRTIPGRKNVFRRYTRKGLFSEDIVNLFSEKPPKNSQSLLGLVIKDGGLVRPMPGIDNIRKYAKDRLSLLPPYCLDLRKNRFLKTKVSRMLKRLHHEIKKGISGSRYAE